MKVILNLNLVGITNKSNAHKEKRTDPRMEPWGTPSVGSAPASEQSFLGDNHVQLCNT